jgi:hypothetical protein
MAWQRTVRETSSRHCAILRPRDSVRGDGGFRAEARARGFNRNSQPFRLRCFLDAALPARRPSDEGAIYCQVCRRSCTSVYGSMCRSQLALERNSKRTVDERVL